MVQHIRQSDTAAIAAGEAAVHVGGSGSWWLLQQEADEAQEVRVFGAFISPELFDDHDVWGIWDVGEEGRLARMVR